MYSLYRAPREAVEPRGPFLQPRGVAGVVYPVVQYPTTMVPRGYTPWVPGCGVLDHRVHHPRHPRAAQEWASGLNGLAG